MADVYDLSPKPDPAAQRPKPVRINRALVAVWGRRLIVPVLVLLGAYTYYRWTEPYRVAHRFLEAVEAQDGAAMYRLALPQERKAVNLSPAASVAVLRAAFPEPVQYGGRDSYTGWHLNKFSGKKEYWSCVLWRDRRSGKALPGDTQFGGQAGSGIQVVPTPEGWRVNVSFFLWNTFRAKWGYPEDRRPFLEALHQAGMTGYIEQYGEVKNLTPDFARL